MTIASETSRISYTTVSLFGVVTLTYAYTFKIFEDTELDVYVDGTLKTLTTHYTVTGAGDTAGGNVVFVSGTLISGQDILIKRVVALTQETDLVENDALPAETLEDGLDKGIMIDQQLNEAIGRAFLLDDTSLETLPFIKDPPTAPDGEILQIATSGALTFMQWIDDPTATTAASAAAALASQVAAAASASTASTQATTSTTQATNSAASAAAAVVSAAAAATSAASGSPKFGGIATGTANALVITSTATALANGMIISWINGASDNTSTATINPGGLGVIALQWTPTVVIAAGDLKAKRAYMAMYDSTNAMFLLMNQ